MATVKSQKGPTQEMLPSKQHFEVTKAFYAIVCPEFMDDKASLQLAIRQCEYLLNNSSR